MKKKISLALAIVMLFALAACTDNSGSNANTTTVTGQGDGYGGVINATVVLTDGKLTNVTLEGSSETPTIGGAALETLAAEMKKAGSADVDAVSGATLTSNGAIYAVKNAMDPAANPYPAPAPEGGEGEEGGEKITVLEPATEIGSITLGDGLRLGQALYAAHGDKGFALTTIALDGETVLDVYIDEYQFQGNATAVPNSDGSFGTNYAGENQMASKRVNSAAYSENMATRGGSTVSYVDNIVAIENFLIGKTISEIEAFVGENDAAAATDAVSGATLADTRGYIMSVLAAAENAATYGGASYDGDASALKLGRVEGAAHGDKCFTVAAALTDGETVVLSYVDEFQTTDASETIVGVPGSNGGFGEGFNAGLVLISKRYNDGYYSALMTDHAGSTVSIADNYDAIQEFCNGKTIADLEGTAASGEAAIDAVSGATLADTAGYIQTIIDAAKAA